MVSRYHAAMPHCLIEYSGNLHESGRWDELCKKIAQTMLAQKHSVEAEGKTELKSVFPIGGVRVRAHAVDHWCIGDGRFDANGTKPASAGFVHLEMKVGAGRSADTLKRAGDAVFDTVKSHFAQEFSELGLALSMEINEFSEDGSWKHNNLHQKFK
jgi:5-carboxymethyl-2-hydroxymuconate isomerase